MYIDIKYYEWHFKQH